MQVSLTHSAAMQSSPQVWIKRKSILNAQYAFEVGQKLTESFDYSKINLSDTDTMHKELRYFFGLMKVLSIFPISTNEKTGKFEFDYFSLRTVYLVALYIITTAAFSYTFQDGLKILRTQQSSSRFDNDVSAYPMYLFNALHLVPLLTIFGSKKMANYQTQWNMLQAKYAHTTGGKVAFKLGRNVWILFAIVSALSVLMVIMQFLFYNQISDGSSIQISRFMLMSLYYTYLTWMGACSIGHWIFTAQALFQIAKEITSDVKAAIDRKSMQNLPAFESLWLDASKLFRATGETFCHTVLYLLVFLFLMAITCTYTALARFSMEGYKFVDAMPLIHAAFTFFFLSFISSCADNAVKTLGEDFQNVLLQARCAILTDKNKKEIHQFLQTISSSPPVIDLGGYVKINNGLCTSMISTMVTYLVVLLQFRFSGS